MRKLTAKMQKIVNGMADGTVLVLAQGPSYYANALGATSTIMGLLERGLVENNYRTHHVVLTEAGRAAATAEPVVEPATDGITVREIPVTDDAAEPVATAVAEVEYHRAHAESEAADDKRREAGRAAERIAARAEENADQTGRERGFAPHTLEWYSIFLDSYGLLRDTIEGEESREADEAPLATATPLEIDTKLAEIYKRRQDVQNRIRSTVNSAHRTVGDKQDRWAKGQPWGMTHEHALGLCREQAATAEPRQPWDIYAYNAVDVIAAYDAALADMAALDGEDDALEAEYGRRPWSRFFLVTSSNGGHIHRDMHCSTCRPTTTYGWLPELSGKDEAAAVASEGTILCSVCFPTAPVAWTLGKTPEGRCSGGGQAPAGEVDYRYARGPFAKCSGCGMNQTVTQAGLIKQHKAAKAA